MDNTQLKGTMDELRAKLEEGTAQISTVDEKAAKIRGEIGRLKRTYNALVADGADISIDIAVVNDDDVDNTEYKLLSSLYNDIIADKVAEAEALEADISAVKEEMKKTAKVIATLESLLG